MRLFLFGMLSLALACESRVGAKSQADEGSCKRWAAEVCKQTEPDTSTCDSVQSAAEVLSPAACSAALADAPGLRQLVAARGTRCGQLAERLCADIGTYTRSCKRVRGESKQFEPDRCVRMLQAYPRVLSELQRQAASAYLPAEQIPALTAGDPPALGRADAKLQLVEFLDYENRDCAVAAGLVREYRARYGADLRYVVRQFPLDYHAHAQLAAEAALAARAQGQFWQMHEALLADTAHVDRPSLERRARELKLDMQAFDAALDTHRFAAEVARDKALAQTFHVEGMPTLFLNGERMLNAVDRDLTIEALDEHLVRTRYTP